MPNNCRDCAAFHAAPFGAAGGSCRRHAPVVMKGELVVHGLWPPTRPDEWCLEWSRKGAQELDYALSYEPPPQAKPYKNPTAHKRRRRRKKINFKKPPTYKSPVPERRKKDK